MKKYCPQLAALACSFLMMGLLVSCKQDKKVEAEKLGAATEQDTSLKSMERKPNPWKNAGCDLFTNADFAKVFGGNPDKDLSRRSLPEKGYCLMTWMKPDWKERDNNNDKPNQKYQEFKNTLVIQVVDYGTDVTSQDQFNALKTNRRNVFEEEVPGIGDGALWSTSTTTLQFRKGHLHVLVTLDMAENAHDNLEKVKEVAAAISAKM